MKHCLLLCGLVAALFALSSCSTTRYVSVEGEYNDMWRGHTYAEVIKAYGAPDRETADGAGGIILIYERTTVTTSTTSDGYYRPYYYYPWGPTLRTTTSTEKDYVHFYIDKEDKCYQVKTNQVKPDGTQVDTGQTIAAATIGTALGVALICSIFGTRRCYF